MIRGSNHPSLRKPIMAFTTKKFGNYIEVQTTTKDFMDEKESVKVNWSCLGSVDVSVANQFMLDMKAAVQYAREQNAVLEFLAEDEVKYGRK